jgi:RimJ/RimL family protein N-acetyltransferase
MLRLPGGDPIGESFMAPLPDGYAIGAWRKPDGVTTVMGDIKLDRRYWGRGLGTDGMRQVVRWVFRRTHSSLFVVPPHERNRAAQRVYEKAGFQPVAVMADEPGHRVMELSRHRYRSTAALSSGSARKTQSGGGPG